MAEPGTETGGRDARGAVKEQAGELKALAREKGAELKERALDRAESRKDEASEGVRAISFALEHAADTLEERGQSWLAHHARTRAEQVDRLTGYFQDHDVREIARDVEDAVRARPAIFLAGTFAAGVALSRFLKASGPVGSPRERGLMTHGYESRTTPGSPGGYDTSPGYGAAHGYVGTAPRRRERPISERTGARGREPEPDVLADMERPGIRTGGVAMASRDAGSGRSTEVERAGGGGTRGGAGVEGPGART